MPQRALKSVSPFLLAAALLLILFVVVRWIFLKQVFDSPLVTFPILDSDYYYSWARQLAEGKGHPPGPFWLSPFYAIFMAALFKLFGSTSVTLVLTVQALLSVGTVMLVAAFTRKLFGDAAALWTAGIAALYGPWLYYDGVMLSASLILFLDALLLFLLVTQTDLTLPAPEQKAASGRDAIWLVLGLVTALSAMTRPSVLIFALVLVVWQTVRGGALWWRRVLLYAVAVAVPLAPVIAYNVSREGGFTLTTASGGVNFFIGNRRGASGVYDELNFVRSFDPRREAEGYRDEACRRTEKELTLTQASRYWALQAAGDIVSNPGAWLRLLIKKAWLTAQREEIPNNMSFTGVAGFAPIVRALPVRWGLLFPLAAAGAFLAWRRRPQARLLLAYAGSYLAVTLIFFSSSEYRFPMILALLPAAGCFFVELGRILRARKTRDLLVLAAVYVVALAVCNFPSRFVAHTVKPHTVYLNMATAAVDRGQVMDAIPLYARALTVDPGYQAARVGLARVLWMLGNYDDARQEFALAGVAPPDSVSGAPLQAFLEELYQHTEDNDYVAALALMDSVFPADRDAPLDVWTNRAMVEAGLGRYDRAVEAMLKAGTKQPDSPDWPHKAGKLALQAGDTARADSLFALSLKILPAYAPARLSIAELALARKDTAAAIVQLNELRRIHIPDDALRYRIRDFAIRLGQDYQVWMAGQQE